MKKKGITILICIFLLGTLSTFIFHKVGKQKPKVVVVLKESNIEYWKIVKAGAEKAFEDFGLNGIVLAPETTFPVENQINIIKKVLLEKPDALIVAPSAPTKTIPIFKEFKKEDIPVLLVDTEADWPDQTSFIGTNNEYLGMQAGRLLASMLQPGDKVALIGWASQKSSGSVGADRIKGSKEALKAAGIEVVSQNVVYNETFKIKIGTFLKNHKDLKGIFTADDLMALETLEVLESLERNPRIPVIGADGIKEMVEYIEQGKLTSTVAQNPYDMGYLSVENAWKVLNGESVEKKIDSGVDIITEDNAKDKLKNLGEILIQE